MEVIIAKTQADKEHCYRLRTEIFVEEQNVPVENEMDGLDESAIHFLLLNNGVAIGTSRVMIENKTATIGRVAISKRARGIGAGAFLMKEVIEYCASNDVERISLGSQDHAVGFYKKFGFEVCSEKYMDSNIVHYKMQLALNAEYIKDILPV